MKIKPEHYETLKRSIKKTKFANPKMEKKYENLGLSKKRYVWDLLYMSNILDFICHILYKYLNDSHIETALLKIIKES